ncbi:MAG TPA: M20 family metallopeptidase [Bacteroidales bacterium]|nr:M20 family metallopeptidase [Bacteroidales bacterium]
MPDLKEIILTRAEELHNEVIHLRRHFHKYPELSYEETETSAYICKWLKDNNIPYRDKIAGTGIIAEIKGSGKGNTVIALRAEMDALPILERNDADYSSVNKGKMHACGHDAHMSIVMGTALLLKSISQMFGGTILLIFQPGEEKSPGGAKLMIESGELETPKPDIIIATHNLPELESGKTGYRSGSYMASCDEIYLTVSGRGGHAALPGLTTDQVFIASKLVVRLKETMAGQVSGKEIPAILGIGRISGEGATNVIPEKVEIAGTFRTFDEKWREEGINLVRKIAAETAAEYSVTVDVRIAEGYPVLINDEKLTEKAVRLSEELLGKENVKIFDMRMSSDDFSFYSSVAPSLYYRTGMSKRKHDGEVRKLHTPEFDIDEEGLKTGVANMSWLIINLLSE